MNIFALDSCPVKAAQYSVDRHTIKMVLEIAQVLSTAHRVLDGYQHIDTATGRKIKRWMVPNQMDEAILYKATHVNHPSNVWARETSGNYEWLFLHWAELLKEYTYRYNKVHACDKLYNVLQKLPKKIKIAPQTPFALAMPDEYKISADPVECYRQYYRVGKARLHSWKNREVPTWL